MPKKKYTVYSETVWYLHIKPSTTIGPFETEEKARKELLFWLSKEEV